MKKSLAWHQALSVGVHLLVVDENQRRALRAAVCLVCRMRCISFHGVFLTSSQKVWQQPVQGVYIQPGAVGLHFFPRPRSFRAPGGAVAPTVPPPPPHAAPSPVVGRSWGRVLGLDDSSNAQEHLGEGGPNPGVTWSTSPVQVAAGVEIGLSSGSAMSLGRR